MMKIITFLLLCTSYILIAQQLKSTDPMWKIVEKSNSMYADALISHNVQLITGLYSEDAVLMPEHSRLCPGKNAIKEYYTLWLDSVTVTSYKRTISELQDLGGQFLELGSFTETFKRKGNAPYTYTGKYMALWKKSKIEPGALKVAELWGSNTTFERSVLPEIVTATPDYNYNIDKKMEKEVQLRNTIISTLVRERKGAEHALLFLPDAVYMTYYTPPLMGKEPITAYFTEHEKPGEVIIDKIDLRNGNVYGLSSNNIVVEHGFYNVDYRAGQYSGTVSGKSINIWKRDKNGTLMLYRQAVNHD